MTFVTSDVCQSLVQRCGKVYKIYLNADEIYIFHDDEKRFILLHSDYRTEHKIQHSISILSSYHILFGLINFFPCQVVKTPRAKTK